MVDHSSKRDTSDAFDAVLRRVARTDDFDAIERTKALFPGQTLSAGRFRILRRIGAGAMGVVYEAFDAERETTIALKALKRIEPSAIYRFKNEFRSLGDVVDRNLVRLHELFVEDGCWFITMERIEGVSFQRHVRPEGRLDERRLRRACGELARGIRAIHAAGKLHRDLKPGNVLVDRDERVVLLDFGLVVDADPGGVGRTVEDDVESGTPAYMAPEQGLVGTTSERSDWYGFGVMLYEALTGAQPFRGRRASIWQAKASGDVVHPKQASPDAPSDVCELCLRLLNPDPERRATADDVIRVFPRVEPDFPAAPPEWAPIFLGREAELAQLEACYQRTLNGRAPVVVMISGNSGMGKSALVEHFLERLRNRTEALVLDGRCYEREAVPYKALDGVVDTLSRSLRALPHAEAASMLPRDVHALSRIFPVLNRVEAVASAPRREISDARELQRRAFQAFGEMLVRARDRRPVVLYVDDLHWGDRDSFALLSALGASAEQEPILMITCHRTEESESPLLTEFVQTLRSNRRIQLRTLDLSPLSKAAATRLARELVSNDVDGQQAQSIAAESEGSPLFVMELSRFALQRPHRESRSLLDVLGQRIADLSPPTRQVLGLVAVAATPLERSVLMKAARLPQLDSAIQQLRDNQLVRTTADGQIATFHDRIREAVVGLLDEDEARRLHGALASAMSELGVNDVEPIAHHLREAGDLEKASVYAVQAAEQAAENLAFERAARLYTQALTDGSHGPETKAALQIARGIALENAGRAADAAEDFLTAVGHVDAEQAFDLRVRAAGALMRSGRIDRGQRVIAPIQQRYGMKAPLTDFGALLKLVAHDALLRMRGGAPRQRPLEKGAMQRRINIGWACVRGYTMIDQLRGLGYAYQTTLLAARAGDVKSYALASCYLGAYLTNLGKIERGQAMVRRARELALEHGDAYVRAFTEILEGMAKYFCGDYVESVELLFGGQRTLREKCTGVHWELTAAEAFIGWALYRTGRYRELAQRVPAAAQERKSAGDLYAEVTLSTGIHAIAWLVVDDTDTVERAHQLARTRWPSTRPDLPRCLFHEGETLLELYRGPDPARLEQLCEQWQELRHSPVLRSRTLSSFMIHQRVAVLVLLARHGLMPRRKALGEAQSWVRTISRVRHPAAQCGSRLAAAAVHCARHDAQAAMESLEQARAFAKQSSQRMFELAAARRLGELRGGNEGRAQVEEADRAMREQAVVRPDCIARMLAPACELVESSR